MMNYKETLFFVGKCLTISHEEHNRIIVENEIKSGNVDWDSIVKLSTAHYVFPALYCNLKRANLLSYLPEDLVEFMQHITDLNRERNLQIIKQAKEINELLLANNITPVFLKGTGNLLEGLYDDIDERMVGDIDFLVNKNVLEKTISVLKNNDYIREQKTAFDLPYFIHHPRLKKENCIAAIEIHKELTLEKYAKEFNYELIIKDIFTQKKITFLGYHHQLCLSIIATHINDNGIYFKNIALRNAYDVFLLSKKNDSLKAIENYRLLFDPLNNFIALCDVTFNKITSLRYKPTKEIARFLVLNKRLLNNDSLQKKHFKKWSKYLFIKSRLAIILKAFSNKKTRIWLFKRIINGR